MKHIPNQFFPTIFLLILLQSFSNNLPLWHWWQTKLIYQQSTDWLTKLTRLNSKSNAKKKIIICVAFLCAAPSKILSSWFVFFSFMISPILISNTISPSVMIRSVPYYFSLFWQQCQRYIMSTSKHVDIVVTISIVVSPSVTLLVTNLNFQHIDYFRQNLK